MFRPKIPVCCCGYWLLAAAAIISTTHTASVTTAVEPSCKATVYCLVRASNKEQATDRLCDSLKDRGYWTPLLDRLVSCNRLVAVVGDLSKKNLGIAKDVYRIVASRLTVIWHVGSFVNHMLGYR